MKQILSIIALTVGSFAIVACSEEKKAEKSYEDFKAYVSERRDSAEAYYDKDWETLESEYNEKRVKAEEKIGDWNDEMRAEYASLQSEWDSFREDYVNEKERRDNITKTDALLVDLFPTGINSDLSAVTAANLLEVHTHFVNYVEVHKDEMSREQWDRVELLWETLGTKKNEVEKDLKSADNLKIAELKIKYGAIKATNRPTAKMEENAEAKKE